MTEPIEPGGESPAPDRMPDAGHSITACRALAAPVTVNRAARTVEVVWSTGARARNFVPPYGPILEELDMAPSAVRMDALRSGRAPVLDTHRRAGIRARPPTPTSWRTPAASGPPPAERRYTVNGAVTLGEGKIAITRKLVAAMAGALVVSGGRFYIHAGAPALPAATLTSDDLRGDVTIVGSRPRRDLFNGVRAVYVEPAAAWQPTDAPPLLASNYVTEDGGEAIYRDMEFPLTTSAATVQRLMKIELERNRRQREVAMQANLSALRLRPWDGVTVALDRLTPFPARVTGWALAPDGGVNLQLAEEDPAVWAWNPATDERATGQNPSVVLPNPGVIAAPAAILVETPLGTSFTAIAVSWTAVGSAYLAGYEIEFRPASIAIWQGYAGGFGATAVAIPTAEPTAFRVRAQARSGAVSGWREALVPATASGLAATGIAGGVRLSGGFPADGVRLQVFEASSASLGAAAKLASEPAALPWDRTGLTTGQTRWYWLRSVSAEGNVSAFAGPVTATAL